VSEREPGQSIVFIKIKGLKPAKSRLIEPELALVSAQDSFILEFITFFGTFVVVFFANGGVVSRLSLDF